ncbi:hypothetical protein CLQ_13643 (plasmid) [Clostridium botulinum Af84]|nr:hypothetical protein [Clostridium botulinum]EPS54334.1 hypothetical protein CLQ_13643 [Clostridium botulinum Af84]
MCNIKIKYRGNKYLILITTFIIYTGNKIFKQESNLRNMDFYVDVI